MRLKDGHEKARTLDISMGGAAVAAEFGLRPGEPVQLALTLGETSFRAKARLVRSGPDFSAFRFLNLDSRATISLLGLLASSE